MRRAGLACRQACRLHPVSAAAIRLEAYRSEEGMPYNRFGTGALARGIATGLPWYPPKDRGDNGCGMAI